MCISKCICYHNCNNKFFIMFSCCRCRLKSSSLSWLLLNVFDITNRHLARNPFICDCNLRWLADYLHKNPIETSGARCDAPKRMHRRRIEALRDEKFKCKCRSFLQLSMNGECSPGDCECERGRYSFSHNVQSNKLNWKFDEIGKINMIIFAGNTDYRTRDVSCRVDTECPAACHCERTTVDCSARGLKEIPRDIPLYTTEL